MIRKLINIIKPIFYPVSRVFTSVVLTLTVVVLAFQHTNKDNFIVVLGELIALIGWLLSSVENIKSPFKRKKDEETKTPTKTV